MGLAMNDSNSVGSFTQLCRVLACLCLMAQADVRSKLAPRVGSAFQSESSGSCLLKIHICTFSLALYCKLRLTIRIIIMSASPYSSVLGRYGHAGSSAIY